MIKRTSLHRLKRIFDLEDVSIRTEDCLILALLLTSPAYMSKGNKCNDETHQTALYHIQTP